MFFPSHIQPPRCKCRAGGELALTGVRVLSGETGDTRCEKGCGRAVRNEGLRDCDSTGP